MTIEDVKAIEIEAFDYALPDERIAKYPLKDRDQSKLLIYDQGEIRTAQFADLSDYLPEHSILIRNNTRVIRARLLFRKESGAKIEIFCLSPMMPMSYEQNLAQTRTCIWHCLVGNAKKWKKDGLLTLQIAREGCTSITLTAERMAELEPDAIRFSWDHELSFAQVLELVGQLPIPPYLHRETEDADLKTYQTIYACHEGSVAAPTAGLHFTSKVFEKLKQKKIHIENVTLHVGAGTFKPVKTYQIGDHEMHAETVVIEKSFIDYMVGTNAPIIAVGTTSVRTLESLYYLALIIEKQPEIDPDLLYVTQWQPYELSSTLTARQAFWILRDYMQRNALSQLIFPTGIMIAPGYTYHVVNGIITNFHQPQSTLLLLVSAFIGEDWKKVYDYALTNDYRFLSYGDSSLLLPHNLTTETKEK